MVYVSVFYTLSRLLIMINDTATKVDGTFIAIKLYS